MRVLHINTFSEGGAALCAMRISKALKQQGVESKMLFAEGQENVDDIDGYFVNPDDNYWYSCPFFAKIKHMLMRMPWYMDYEKMSNLLTQANKQHLYIHQPFSQYHNITKLPLFDWADIIHLHWVAGIVDYPSFFKNIKKPIVWTFHDKHPAVGLLHYCAKENNYIPPQLEELNEKCINIKKRALQKHKNVNIVAISRDMFHLCQTSVITRNHSISLIPNGIDPSIFHPYDRISCRNQWGISKDSIVFMYSSYILYDSNKGFLRVVEALERTNLNNKLLVCCGKLKYGEELPATSFPIVYVGLIDDSREMAKLYSAANYFIQASYEESFGQTPIEAMSCGIPVISTHCGISPELIRDYNGVLCNGYDIQAIADGIERALLRTYDPTTIRKYIENEYACDIIAKKYIRLYNSIMGKS